MRSVLLVKAKFKIWPAFPLGPRLWQVLFLTCPRGGLACLQHRLIQSTYGLDSEGPIVDEDPRTYPTRYFRMDEVGTG